ncbi:WLM domain-containing protein [Flagelloscypha sp. PMI_526]|nr:WLM domain-containing protein [Flagelloscypha sp. PMI_526]
MALAAQVKPIMKKHGFMVNSLEEYKYNQVFAGRNWEAGETVGYLLSTLTHELAHIRHMHHGPSFQKLWKQLDSEVRVLRAKGYFGDGFWSSGTLLSDSSSVLGKSCIQEELGLPEFICGGAQNKTRPTAVRRRRGGPRKPVVPSLHTGAQTNKTKKAGRRVTSKYAFQGEGSALTENGAAKNNKKPSTTVMSEEPEGEHETSSDDEIEIVPETDAERRKALQETRTENDLEMPSWKDLDFYFDLKPATPAVQSDEGEDEVEIVAFGSSTRRKRDLPRGEEDDSSAARSQWSCRNITSSGYQ